MFGSLGETGRGLCESAGVLDDCHFIVGTFSKTLGAIGGYCVSNDPDFDILRVTVRSYMFTASLPPAAPRRWPVMDLVEEMEILGARSPKQRLMARVSQRSLIGVEVPWALI